MNDEKYKLTKSQAIAGFLREERAEELGALAASMTREEHVRSLEAKGMSRDAQAAYFARQRQRFEAAIAKETPTNVVPIREEVSAARPAKQRFSLRDFGLGGGFGWATAGVAFVVRALMTVAPPELPMMTATSAVAAPTAPDFRNEAFKACGRAHWLECLDALDRAKELDPDGETDPDVIAAREMATRGLRR